MSDKRFDDIIGEGDPRRLSGTEVEKIRKDISDHFSKLSPSEKAVPSFLAAKYKLEDLIYQDSLISVQAIDVEMVDKLRQVIKNIDNGLNYLSE